MRILFLHNRYQWAGGEDAVVQSETSLLRQRGHDVRLLEADNQEIDSFVSRVKTAGGAIHSMGSRRRVAREISVFQPDLVHVHNFFPLLSPSVFYACEEAGVPVIQTVHNYRLVCSNALLFRDGHVCEECIGRAFAWPGVAHACYRGSRVGTLAVAAMQAFQRATGTWQHRVSLYIALTSFCRDKFIEGGLPATKIVVKPNFISSLPLPKKRQGSCAIFVGRLSSEKGIEVIVGAWERLKEPPPLRIAGGGPLADWARSRTGSRVSFLGPCGKQTVLDLMQEARFLVCPSLCYENLPLVILEAFAAGLPVIASSIGNLGVMVAQGRTGLLFRPGDPNDLATKVEWAWSHPEQMAEMGRAARAEYEAKYTPDRNYEMLLGIYKQVLGRQERPSEGKHAAD